MVDADGYLYAAYAVVVFWHVLYLIFLNRSDKNTRRN